MKRTMIALLLGLFLLTGIGAAEEKISAVQVELDYSRMSTMASNQMALWVENEEGTLVRTIFATSFTAGRRGYAFRDGALNHWVAAANPAKLTDSELDAISSATPRQGHLTYVWDLTDDEGNPVPAGIYRIRLEGTLFWDSNVLYTAEIDLTKAFPGELEAQTERSQPDNHDNETMIQNVAMTVQ